MKMPLLGAKRSEAIVSEAKSRTPRGSPEIALISAMIVQAIREMRGNKQPRSYSVHGRPQRSGESRTKATVWIASKGAEPWFDLMGMDQRFALEAMKWVDEAEAILKKDDGDLTPDERRILSEGIRELAY